MGGRPPPWPYGPSWLSCRAHGSLRGENSLARIWHGYLIVAAVRPPGSAGPDRVFSHPGWSARRLAGGGRTVFSAAQAAPAVFGTAPPRRRAPVRAPGLTCGFWWQVQDSNLGRLSSAILQTAAGTALTWANVRVIRHFGTHLTCSRPCTGPTCGNHRVICGVRSSAGERVGRRGSARTERHAPCHESRTPPADSA
jgi:hypothetical protein